MNNLADLIELSQTPADSGTTPTPKMGKPGFDPSLLMAQIYMNALNNPVKTSSPLGGLNSIIAGLLAGKAMKGVGQTQATSKQQKSKTYGDVSAILNDTKLDSVKKIEALNKMRPLIKETYGDDMDSWIGSIVGDVNKVANQEKSTKLTAAQNVNYAGDLRKELIDRTKDFGITNNAYMKMDTAFKRLMNNPDVQSKNATDQAIVIVFNKMLDPGSVVRESEYARTPEGQSLLSKIQGGFEKVSAGGVGLTDAERAEIVDVTREVLNRVGQEYNDTINMYGGLADRAGVDKELVTGGFKVFSPLAKDPSSGVTTKLSIKQTQKLNEFMKGVDTNKLKPGQVFPREINGKKYIFSGLDKDGMPMLDDVNVPELK